MSSAVNITDTAPVLFEIKDGIAFITLNRPARMNALNMEMALALQQRLDESASRKEVRAVYLTGAGRAFCAGQDIVAAVESQGRGLDKILTEGYNPIVTKIRYMAKPVVAAVNGVAAGAGVSLALCCDVVVAAQSATFIQAFSKIGLIPDSGGTYTLPRLIGWQRASAMAMLADLVSAEKAEKIGMIYEVYPDQEFPKASLALTKKLAQLPTSALGLIKQALNHSADNTLEAQLNLEDELQQKAMKTMDFKEGIDAFLNKRVPQFTGE
ncbi:MAG TPA: enoyl-CoA hydratase-related protein [Puia sp.]|jgi:2-(1,2-epoxy-1,2-dihydrophenyl)acetyl-CoA isomerase|nr:enoyl-CoA hydratase-related protein [Puia sp.]